MARAIIAVFLIVAAAGVARADDGLIQYDMDGWTIEIVRDGDRAACSLIREEADGSALVVSRVSDSPFVLPVLEIAAERDPFGAGPVSLAAGGSRTPVALDTSFDEDGVYVAAYPDIDRADAILAAMQTAAELRLEQGDAAIAAMPLEGFAAAYAEITRICGG